MTYDSRYMTEYLTFNLDGHRFDPNNALDALTDDQRTEMEASYLDHWLKSANAELPFGLTVHRDGSVIGPHGLTVDTYEVRQILLHVELPDRVVDNLCTRWCATNDRQDA